MSLNISKYFQNYNIHDDTIRQRRRKIQNEEKIILHCPKCMTATIVFEASTIFRCTTCSNIQNISRMDLF